MIFVVLGTQKFQCNRLLRLIDDMAENGLIDEEVYAQKGHSDYEPKNYTAVDFMGKEEFDNKVEACSILITHSGVGTILTGINCCKPVIVFPRLKKYKEHVDDHQLDIARAFSRKKLVLMCGEEDDMGELITKCRNMHFEMYESQRDNMINIINNYIEGTQAHIKEGK